MQRNQFIYVLFFFLTLLLSCEDDVGSMLAYPSVYHKAGLASIENLRVFSSTGEIKDNSIISRFSQYDTAYFHSFAGYISDDDAIVDTVYFFDGQRAILHHEYKNFTCQVSRKDDLLVMTENVAASRCCTYGEVFTLSLPYYLGKIKPEVLSESITSSVKGNYNFSYWGRRKFVFHESHGQVVSPMIMYFKRSGSFDSGFVNNLLQPDFYKNLAAGDTVTIMEFKILFEK